jgi:hypothetical protein
VTIVLIIVGSIVALFGVLALLGARLPAAHQATVTLAIPATAAELYARVSDVASWPAWNKSVRRVTKLPDHQGHEHWLVQDGNGKIPSAIVERTPPTRFVTEITDAKLPFGGRWIWSIAEGSVSITEDGFVRNLIFRFLARHVFGHTSTMQKTLDALAASFR